MPKRTLLLTTTICAVSILAINQPVHSQINEFELTAGDAAAENWFRFRVSVSGDYAVAGAHRDDIGIIGVARGC